MNESTPWLTRALRKFDRFPLSVRFLLAFTPLVIAVVWMTFFSAADRYQVTRDLERLERHTSLAVEAGNLVGQLQRERSTSITLLESDNPAKLREYLREARAATDNHLTSLRVQLDQPMSRSAGSSYLSDLRTLSHSLNELAGIRSDIDQATTTSDKTDQYFTSRIEQLNSLIGRLSAMTEHNQIGRKLNAYFILNRLKELLGQERLIIARAIISHELTEPQQQQLVALAAQQQTALKGYRSQIDNDASYADLTLESPITALRDRLINSSEPSTLLQETRPEEWFVQQSDRARLLTSLEAGLAGTIRAETDQLLASAREELWRYLLISPLTLLACLTFAVLIFQQTQLRFLLTKAVFEHTHDRITVTDSRANIIEVNDAFTRNTGYSRQEVLGHNPNMLQSGRQSPEFYKQMWQELKATGKWQGEIWNRRRNGEFFAELTTINAITNRHGNIENYVSVSSDITDRAAQHERELEYRAYHDPLTGLPNQILLRDRLEHALMLATRSNDQIVVAAFDLDHFSQINEKYGHAAGDVLIERIARRLQSIMRDCDTIARTGGDELLVVIEQLENPAKGRRLLERLQQELAQPIEFNGFTTTLTASIGATAFPEDDGDADTLIRHATEALHQAKHNGRARLSWFDPEQGRDQSAFSQLLHRLEKAIVENELCLHYQPKVDMATGELLGVESLLRWQDPERGMIPPGAFLPQVEQHPISIDIGNWVLDTAISQVQRWKARGIDVSVSVNINAVHLLDPDFISTLRGHIRRYPGFNPANLELEILESTAINDIELAGKVLTECRKLGVHVSLDDFGTGFAALDYLKRLPADTLKIDQSFVRDMEDDKGNRAIIKGIIGLARAFSFDVIAEGVETTEQGCTLIELGCVNAQGFGIARPMPAHEFDSWRQTWKPPAAWRQRKAG